VGRSCRVGSIEVTSANQKVIFRSKSPVEVEDDWSPCIGGGRDVCLKKKK